MASRGVDLNVAGMTCRVVTSAADDELAMLAAMVEEILLVAIALAHEVHEERTRARTLADRARTTLAKLLERVDGVLSTSDDLALERHGDVSIEGRGAPRKRFREEPKPRRPLPDVTVDRLRDVVRTDKARSRPAEKERGSE